MQVAEVVLVERGLHREEEGDAHKEADHTGQQAGERQDRGHDEEQHGHPDAFRDQLAAELHGGPGAHPLVENQQRREKPDGPEVDADRGGDDLENPGRQHRDRGRAFGHGDELNGDGERHGHCDADQSLKQQRPEQRTQLTAEALENHSVARLPVAHEIEIKPRVARRDDGAANQEGEAHDDKSNDHFFYHLLLLGCDCLL